MRDLELGKRSHVSRGARVVAGIAFIILGAAAVFSTRELGPMAWLFFGVALTGLMTLMVWKADDAGQLAEEDLIEVAQQSLRNEAERLDARRLEIDKKLMAYAEWMEFPDFSELHEMDWAVAEKSVEDAKVAELLARQSDDMLARFSEGTYWEEGQFQTRLMLLNLFNFVEEVAKIYTPGTERPLLDTNLESIFKAINRASLQVILLMEELPMVDVKEFNLRKMSDRIRQAAKVYRKYSDIQPLLEPVRYIWQGSKLLLASNPLLAAGWIAGSELLWKGGKKFGKKALDAYLLSMVRQTLGIIAWETATIYDKSHRYRNPDFVYGVELTHLVSLFELNPATLRQALKELGTIPLRSSYDRVFLYRCVAQHVSPKPEYFSQSDLMDDATREQLAERLETFFEKNIQDPSEKKVARWKAGLAKRLNVALVSDA